MSRPDFLKKWASSRPSIPAISDPDYALGFANYLGAIPPSTDDHDYIMNLQDQRAVWLANSQLDSVRLNVASAATVNLSTAAPDTRHINITGTTTINSFTVEAGRAYFVRFDSALTLTNSGSIVTQSGANITTSAGDTCIIRSTAANVVEVLSYMPAGGWAKSLAANGYQKLPGGLIIQWGIYISPGTTGQTVVTFPIAFPTERLSSLTSASSSTSTTTAAWRDDTGVTATTGLGIRTNAPAGALVFWIAFGR